MAETPTINGVGKSGQKYLYYIYPIGTNFEKEAGNYVFALQSNPNRWRPIYIGQTEDLSERFDNHHGTTRGQCRRVWVADRFVFLMDNLRG